MQEPFLVNEPRRRRPKGHRRGCPCFACGGRKRRRRGRRRNPDAVIYNRPRRKGRRRGRRRGRRNPPRGGFVGQIQSVAPKVGWGAVGAVASEAVPAVAARFGVPMPAGRIGQIGVKLASGLTVAWIVRRFVGRGQGNAALVGAFLPSVIDTVRPWIAPMLGLGAYTEFEPSVGAYLPEEYEPMGYLAPGYTVGQYDDDSVPTPSRLSPDERL